MVETNNEISIIDNNNSMVGVSLNKQQTSENDSPNLKLSKKQLYKNPVGTENNSPDIKVDDSEEDILGHKNEMLEDQISPIEFENTRQNRKFVALNECSPLDRSFKKPVFSSKNVTPNQPAPKILKSTDKNPGEGTPSSRKEDEKQRIAV